MVEEYCSRLNSFQYHVDVHLRYLMLWLYCSNIRPQHWQPLTEGPTVRALETPATAPGSLTRRDRAGWSQTRPGPSSRRLAVVGGS